MGISSLGMNHDFHVCREIVKIKESDKRYPYRAFYKIRDFFFEKQQSLNEAEKDLIVSTIKELDFEHSHAETIKKIQAVQVKICPKGFLACPDKIFEKYGYFSKEFRENISKEELLFLFKYKNSQRFNILFL